MVEKPKIYSNLNNVQKTYKKIEIFLWKKRRFRLLFSHFTLFFIPKKFLNIVRNKIKNQSYQLDKNPKSYSRSKNFQKKLPKNSKILVYKYIEVLEFLKKSKTFINKGTKHKKNYMEGLNSKNKNIKGGGSP